MCFSAGASFAVGVGLIGPGYYAIKRTESKGMLLYASTPLLFSFHQIAEGFLWLSLTNPDFAALYNPALYGYSFISQPIWPIWAPLVIWLMEPDKQRKKILNYLVFLGLVTSLYMFYCLIKYDISAVVENHHIRYYRDFPYLHITRPLNFITVAIAPFLSTLRFTKVVAFAMFGSMVFTYFFFTEYLISVWCFFAAILSLLIILVVVSNRHSVENSPSANQSIISY